MEKKNLFFSIITKEVNGVCFKKELLNLNIFNGKLYTSLRGEQSVYCDCCG